MDPAEVSDARWAHYLLWLLLSHRREFLTIEPTFATDREFVDRVLPQL